MARGDIYLSCDVEADGPIPGPYSMLSFGFAVGATFDGRRFERQDPAATTFYAELQPISDEFVPEALAVSGLDREVLKVNGETPQAAMTRAHRWVTDVSGEWSPIFVAYPLAFDWTFMSWYFTRYSSAGSPFGFSAALDMKTFFAAKLNRPITGCTKRNLPKHWRPARPHTHNGLDDAIEQAELFANAWEAST